MLSHMTVSTIAQIIECMDIHEAKQFCMDMNLDLDLAFKISRFTLKTQKNSNHLDISDEEFKHLECQYLFNCFEEISALTEYEDRLLHSLWSNKSFYPYFNPLQTFILASGLGLEDVVQSLIHHPDVDPAYCCNFAVCIASFCENINVLKLLLEDPRVDPSANDNNAFIAASSNGALDVMNILLEDPRVDPSARDNYAIVEASSCGEYEIVDRLLRDPRVDPSAADNLAIKLAYKHGNMKVVERLLHHLNLDTFGDYSLDSKNYYEGIMEKLLQDGRASENSESFFNYSNLGSIGLF